MRTLATVRCDMKHCVGDVKVVEWHKEDPFPNLGPSVGVDTETELITDTELFPPVVVLGCFDPRSMTCYVVYWKDMPAFMKELCRRDIEQRYFNLGFDEGVIDNEMEDLDLLTAIDQNRVRDMQIRIHLHEIATLGFIRGDLYNLKGCTMHFLNHELDKGDGTENSARLSFRRYNPDGTERRITDEQAQYLPFDCISTWALGEEVAEAPRDPRIGVSCELAHVKGMVVLAHISANGFPVDMRIFKALEDKLKVAREEYRQQLLGFGFPDPDKDATAVANDFKLRFHAAYKRLLALGEWQSELPMYAKEEDKEASGEDGALKIMLPSKATLRMLVVYMYNYSDDKDELHLIPEVVKGLAEGKPRGLRKDEKQLYDQMCEQFGIASVDASTKGIAYPAFVTVLMEQCCEQWESGYAKTYGFSFDKACAQANDVMDEHQDWFTKTEPIGPTKFFQQHVQKLVDAYPQLGDPDFPGHLKKTEKSDQWKLTLKDMWRLKDLDVTDKFLDAYTGFKHCVKMMSTYLNHENVKADGRMHPHFTNVVRTGRTSSTKPNI